MSHQFAEAVSSCLNSSAILYVKSAECKSGGALSGGVVIIREEQGLADEVVLQVQLRNSEAFKSLP